ncbi:MAG: metal-sensitive transcriptional regulator [Carboxydocellales bacterium]|jgi:DNA-binding FrmR family transcriptional regulator
MVDTEKEAIIKRFRIIRGHISGIEKMIEGGKECADIMVQMAAVTASMAKVKLMISKHMVEQCIEKALVEENDIKKEITKILDNILKISS